MGADASIPPVAMSTATPRGAPVADRVGFFFCG